MADLTGAAAILEELEARHIQVRTSGQDLELVGPKGALPDELAEEIRRRKRELLELVTLRGWPEESLDALRRFQRPEAKLYPFLGRAVVTPQGHGRLVAVFADRAVVALAIGPPACFMPSEVRPPGVECQDDHPGEVVH